MAAGAAFTLLVAGLVSGCGENNDSKQMEPVEFGTARPVAEKLAISAPTGGVVPAGTWPSACKFLTDGEITALLPQAGRIERRPSKVSVISIFDKAQNESAAEGSCSYSFWLKGVTIEDIDASIRITVSAVADPALVTAHYAEQLDKNRTRGDRQPFEDHTDQFGPQGCHSWPSSNEYTVLCRQGPLMFELSGFGYGAFTGVPDGDLSAKGRQWRDKVLAAVAHIVAAKVP